MSWYVKCGQHLLDDFGDVAFPDGEFVRYKSMPFGEKVRLKERLYSAEEISISELNFSSFSFSCSNVTLPDYLLNLNLPYVSGRLKGIIEGFEPGMHQFFPVAIILEDPISQTKRLYEYYLMNVLTILDIVDVKNSVGCQEEDLIGGRVKLVINPSVRGFSLYGAPDSEHGKHIWFQKNHIFPRGNFFLSDELYQTVKIEGITGFAYPYHVETLGDD